MRHLALFLVVLAFSPPQPVGAQDTLVAKLGDRVRVTAPDCSLPKETAEFQAVVRDSLFLRVGGDDLTCPIAALNRLEVFQGRRRRGKGTTLGALIGGGLGAGLGFASSGAQSAVVGAILGGGFGAFPGVIGNGPRGRVSVLVGTGAGAVIGWVAGESAGECGTATGPKDSCAGETALVGGVLGIAAGSIIGLILGEDRWEEVALPPGRPTIHLTVDGRLGLGLSILLRK